MAKRKNVYDVLPMVVNMPRDDLMQLIQTLKKDPCALNSHPTLKPPAPTTRPLSHNNPHPSARRYSCALDDIASQNCRQQHKDYTEHFDQCCCSDEFRLSTQPKPGVTTFRMEYCEASKLVEHVLSECPSLAARFAEALRRHPSTPSQQWNTIIGFDEFNAGDKLCSFLGGKKVMCLYFTFEESESAHLGDTWFCMLTTRSAMIASVQGGWSHLLVKVTATRVDNLRRFERSVLSGSLNAHIASLKGLRGPCSFASRTQVFDSLPGINFGEPKHIWAAKLTIGDVVMRQGIVGELFACVLEVLKNGILKKVKKFKMDINGSWLFDIEAMLDFV